MKELQCGVISVDRGLEGDHKGPKFPKRRITVLALEDWRTALAALAPGEGAVAPDLPWTVRRANLLVEGMRLPRAAGAQLRIGPVLLEVTYPTQPCARMDEVWPGLLKALHPDWRGGITARVLEGGEIAIGDAATIEFAPDERRIRLP
jgi:MOSC domain-containing protein YiiM